MTGTSKVTLSWAGLYFEDDAVGKCAFPVSNETYDSKTMSILKSLEGIERYAGVCGGGTQNLFLLDVLTYKNRIQQACLVDTDREQLYNMGRLARICDDSEDDEEYSSAIRQHVRERGMRYHENRFPVYLTFRANSTKPHIKNDIVISMLNDSIENYLDEIAEPGKYFVYLSNALVDHINMTTSIEILHDIESNDRFCEGSVVFLTDQSCSGAMLLEKRGCELYPMNKEMSEYQKDLYDELVSFRESAKKR